MALIALSVWCCLEAVTSTFELSQITHSFPASCLEDDKILSIDQMIADRAVATLKNHIADLTLAKVAKGAFARPTICVAVLLATIASEDDYHGVLTWRADAALLLSSIDGVDVTTTIVESLLLERSPWHNLLSTVGLNHVHTTDLSRSSLVEATSRVGLGSGPLHVSIGFVARSKGKAQQCDAIVNRRSGRRPE
ncbi:hypothetical protein ACETIH_09580 [Microvirga arabica]|uniref:Uncharacterized protein n=1 Tax=Microvirga arabica TaxID=1128671 RepID=A0ABV6Y6S6_9HYPH